MIRRRKFLANFDFFKNKKFLQFNVIIDNLYFMENLYKYSMTKRFFLKKRKHFFINYNNHCNLKFFGFYYINLKKNSKELCSNSMSLIVINKFFFSSALFSYFNKYKLLKQVQTTKSEVKEMKAIKLLTIAFQLIKLLSLQKQITTILLKSRLCF